MTHKWLDRVCRLSIKVWRYNKGVDPAQRLHIGPMADEWHRIMGIGDGVTIDGVDAVGILLKSMQELRAEVSSLKSQIVELQDQLNESVHTSPADERDATASAIVDAFARDVGSSRSVASS